MKGQKRHPALRRLRATTVGIAALSLWFASSALTAQTVAGASPIPSPTAAAPVRVGTAPSAPTGAQALTAPPTTTSIQVTVVLQPRDPAALAQFATEVSTPGTPLYRHYLARGQFPSVFGPTAASIDTVEATLRAEGLHPGTISADHLSIPVTATTGELANAFSIGFRRYQLPGGRVAYANTAAPLIPAGAAGLVQGVIGLDDLQLDQPVGPLLSAKGSSTASIPHVVTGGPQPCSTAVTDASEDGAYTADQLASAYQFSSLYGAGDLGAGQTIGLFELASNSTSDIAAYQTCYGTSTSVSYVAVDGGPTTDSGSIEATLDIEDVIGLAPKAKILVYEGPYLYETSFYDTYSAMVTQDLAQVLSTSWGVCEAATSYIGIDAVAENALFEEAAGQGQTILDAAGDSGSEDCYRIDTADTGLAVMDPASQPFVTSVGGTTLTALGPPPTETVWNEAADGAGAGGGGISENWTMPWYQSSAPSSLHVIGTDSSGTPCGAPTGTYCREVPDVSADADPYTGYLIYYNGPDSYVAGWQDVGGTSAGAPLWAALMALTNADSTCSGTTIGFANPVLYAAPGSSSYSSAFHDITSGNNDYTGNNEGLYPAGTGYDMASGLGTPNASKLSGLLCTPGAITTAVSTLQYRLANSDGSTWQPMDTTNLSLTITPTSSENVLLSANADLWTFNAGYNQDIGIQVTPGSGTPVLAAWKESGGFAGTFSPNAAFVETVYPMSAGTTYTVQIVWKTNKAAIGATIAAGAGPISSAFSPTRLTADVLPAGYQSVVSTTQYSSINSNGSTWAPIDPTHLVTTAFAPSSAESVVVSGNADLWTANAGYNQDLGIFVSVNGATPVLVAWKESGGFAGTFSPNAAFVQTVYPMTGGSTYAFSLEWKTNKPSSGTIFAGAGPIGSAYSPTRLTAYPLPADAAPDQWATAVSTTQYSSINSNGSTWGEMDATNLATGSIAIGSGGTAETVLVSGNADLWTANGGYNQDLGIEVSVNGGTPTLMAWKESGGFAGTFSPNAAFVQAVYRMEPGNSYVFSLWWKTNKPANGTIFAGAGPIGTAFSPTRLTVVP